MYRSSPVRCSPVLSLVTVRFSSVQTGRDWHCTMSTQELDRAKEMWARAEWEPDEAKKKSLAHQIITAFDELLAADNDELSKIERAAVHNLRGLAYAMLGGAEHLELARHDYKRALKLNGSMGQASKNLQAVNAALHARDVAAKNAKIRQRRLKYCCGCVPRCKKGPWKPKVKTVRGHCLLPAALRLALRYPVSRTYVSAGGLRWACVREGSAENTSSDESATEICCSRRHQRTVHHSSDRAPSNFFCLARRRC